jgi:hypothetical protein
LLYLRIFLLTIGYCPAAARGILGRVLEYDDAAPFKTAQEAIAAAKADPTVPKGATFETFPQTKGDRNA